MVESTRCPSCTLPVLPGQAFCPNCGASLAGTADRLVAPAVEIEPAPAVEIAPAPVVEIEPAPAPGLDPALLSDPAAGGTYRIPGSYLPPTDELLPSTWTLQPSGSSIVGRRPGSSPSPSAAVAPISAPITIPPRTATEAASDRTESARELVPFGLCVAGAALGIASFFLPWTGVSGIGVGTTQAGATNQWAFAMPAGIPLLVLTALILAGIAGSDRAQLELPKLASAIGRVTYSILPMLLGGLYLGVVLLYVTLPSSFGYGMGIVVLLVAALLLVAGSVASIFFPSEPAPKVE